nr:MAG TPA: hypothetical protein [Caudoviricetes sp.]
MSSARIGALGVYRKSDKPPHLVPKISAKTKKAFTHTSITPSGIYYYNISYILIKQHTQ